MTESLPRNALRAVVGQADWWWSTIFRPRLVGLTDEEFLWQPAPGSWTLHPAEGGAVTSDFAWPPPDPSPVTTIAWRLCHIGVGCLANRTTALYPASAPEPLATRPWEGPLPFPYSAQAALAFLDDWWAAWLDGIQASGEDGLWEPIGEREWDVPQMQLGSADPVIGLVLHVHRELMHHGGEVGLLRDLYPHLQVR